LSWRLVGYRFPVSHCDSFRYFVHVISKYVLKGRMEIKVTISNTLDDLWGDPDELVQLGEQGIIDLVCEDIVAFIDGAEWEVEIIEEKEEK